MSIDKEKAQSLAASYLRERGYGGLILSSDRLAVVGDEVSPQPDRDLWLVLFERPPLEPGEGWISGGLVMVTIDNNTLELNLC